MKQFWVDKYAPTTFDDFCFADKSTKKQVIELLRTNNIPHLLLTGAPGTGKSTLARLIIEYNNIDPLDVLTIDATLENNVDTIRNRVYTFVTTAAFASPVKIVVLEEFDHMSIQSQSTLREMMVRYSDDVRFILTANYEHKIIDAIKSRGWHIVFEHMPRTTAVQRLVSILDSEKVEFNPDDVLTIVDQNTPDLRKMINIIQQSSVGGALVIRTGDDDNQIAKFMATEDFVGFRKAINDFTPAKLQQLYQHVYTNLENCESIANDFARIDKAIISIAKYQSQHAASANPAICAAALISELNQISKGTI